MQWKIFFLCSLCLYGVVWADGDEDVDQDVDDATEDLQAKANAFLDDFIAKATNVSGGFSDPLDLEEIGESFEREIAFVKVKGEAKLYDGKITGLSTLKRKGNATVIDLDDLLIISCQMSFEKVTAFYRGTVTLNNIGPKITLNAKINRSSLSMFLTVPREGGEAALISLNVNRLTDIRVSIWGLGPMGWAASIIGTLAVNALEQPVAKLVSVKVFEHFSKEIGKVPYPA